MNDSSLFRHMFNHIKQEYTKHEKAIKKKMNIASGQNENQEQLSKSS